MSDDPVRTIVRTDAGELAFQDYFVRPPLRAARAGFRFAGSRTARVPPALRKLIEAAPSKR